MTKISTEVHCDATKGVEISGMSWKVHSTASSAILLDIVASSHTMAMHRRLSCALHPWSYATTLSAASALLPLPCTEVRILSPLIQNGGRSFSGFSPNAPRLKRICAYHPLEDTLRQVFQSAVKVSWRFGCVHARRSRTTVFNSSLHTQWLLVR